MLASRPSPTWRTATSTAPPVATLLAAWLLLAACTSRPDAVARRTGPEPHGGHGGADGGRAGAGHGGDALAAGAGGHAEATTGGASPRLGALALTGDLDTHDSCVIESEGVFYLYRTGTGIPFKTSVDLLAWQDAGSVFSELPPWVSELVPDATGIWAPDIEPFAGAFHLYYAVSTFGSGRSCIGHASTTDLANEDWTDHGPVICSNTDGAQVDWDAIDPSAFVDLDGNPWLVFGSFGSGIKLIPLTTAGDRVGDSLYSLAARPTAPSAIQAAFLWYRAPHYYLFVSFDWCCRGVDSDYNIRVGRASSIHGPYLDRDGRPLLDGGGTLLLEGSERWRGAGANTLLTTGGRDYNVYHSYDANAAGRATLRIAELAWDEAGWPLSGGP